MKTNGLSSIVIGLILMIAGMVGFFYEFTNHFKGYGFPECGPSCGVIQNGPSHTVVYGSLIAIIVGLVIFILGCIDASKNRNN